MHFKQDNQTKRFLSYRNEGICVMINIFYSLIQISCENNGKIHWSVFWYFSLLYYKCNLIFIFQYKTILLLWWLRLHKHSWYKQQSNAFNNEALVLYFLLLILKVAMQNHVPKRSIKLTHSILLPSRDLFCKSSWDICFYFTVIAFM